MKSFSFFLFLVIAVTGRAQDVHFSQMKFTPMSVNPSLVGLNGKYNATVNYRNQWNSVADPFQTLGASFDMKFNESRRNGSFLALGVNFFHDEVGDIHMTSSNISANIAYHLRFNRQNTFGTGIQIGYSQRGIGNINGAYESQYNGSSFDQSILSGENYSRTGVSYIDAGAGFVFNHNSLNSRTFNSSGYKLSIGVSVYHLNTPDYTYLVGGDNDLDMRFTGFVQSEFNLNSSDWSLMPAAYYQRQGSHQEFIFGTYIKYNIAKSSSLTSLKNGFSIAYGPFYRVGDAFVNKLLISFKEYSLGISYDLNVSSLTQASKGRGGFELMFNYSLPENHQSRVRIH